MFDFFTRPLTKEEVEGYNKFWAEFFGPPVAIGDFLDQQSEPETGCCDEVGCCMDEVAESGAVPLTVTAPTTINFEMVQNGFVITVTDEAGVRRYIEDCECNVSAALEAWMASHG